MTIPRSSSGLPAPGGFDKITPREALEYQSIVLSLLHSLPANDEGIETQDVCGPTLLTMRQAYAVMKRLRAQGAITRKLAVTRRPLSQPGSYRLFDLRPNIKVCKWRRS